MNTKAIWLFLLIPLRIFSQELSLNFNINKDDPELAPIVELWQSYLRTNDRSYWMESEVKDLSNPNIQDMGGILNPSLMEYGLNNKILSIRKYQDGYKIRSMFLINDQVFAITEVLAKREKNNWKLSNYIFDYTKDWQTVKTNTIDYIIHPAHVVDHENIKKAEQFLERLCGLFDLPQPKITYFIVRDCDDIYKSLGYDYYFREGQQPECGYYESKNNFIFATSQGGEAHYHELTHYINAFFPKAHELLLTGISAYLGGEKAHFGKPLEYHTKRVSEYLQQHPEIDLSKFTEFYTMDSETNPQYVIGAILCDLIIQHSGKTGLIDAFNNTENDEKLYRLITAITGLSGEDLNQFLRDAIGGYSKNNKSRL